MTPAVPSGAQPLQTPDARKSAGHLAAGENMAERKRVGVAGHRAPLSILLLNWQDRENPRSGGAEIHLHEIFGRLAARGHKVRAVVSGWPGARPSADVEGIAVTRVGGRYSYALRARRAARRALRSVHADLIVEDINKFPLYTPSWTRKPVVVLVPHLFGTTAFKELPPHLAGTVWAAERLVPRVYERCRFQAISESTKRDLSGRGVPDGNIAVIHPGIDRDLHCPGAADARDRDPTLLYVGRLQRYKGIETLFDAFARLRAEIPRLRLAIAGRGDHARRLEATAAESGAGDGVRFLGPISDQEKVAWLRRAWVVVYPSPKEGWGLVAIEAAACGTPVVASDSPGLRESVAAGRSGLLARHGDAASWTRQLRVLLENPAERERLGRGGIKHAARFSWERAADETEAHLYETLIASANRG